MHSRAHAYVNDALPLRCSLFAADTHLVPLPSRPPSAEKVRSSSERLKSEHHHALCARAFQRETKGRERESGLGGESFFFCHPSLHLNLLRIVSAPLGGGPQECQPQAARRLALS